MAKQKSQISRALFTHFIEDFRKCFGLHLAGSTEQFVSNTLASLFL